MRWGDFYALPCASCANVILSTRSDSIHLVIVQETRPDGGVWYSTLHPTTLAASLKEEFPGVERASGFIRSQTQVSHQKVLFRESFGLVEPDFLRMFSFPLLAGDPEQALRRPDGVVLSETVARTLYGNPEGDYRSALGNPLLLGDHEFTVAGVMRDVPENSSLNFSLLIPIEHHRNYSSALDDTGGKTAVYVELANTQEVDALESAFPPFAEQHLKDRIGCFKTRGRVRNTDDGFLLRLQPLRDVYLDSDGVKNSYEASGKTVYSYLLSGLAILVLTVACINYVTLAAGRSVGRASEVGMRRVLGAHRRQLMRQFWGEALFLSLVALAMGIALAEMFLPAFNDLARKNLDMPYLDSWGTPLALLGMVCIVGLAAGSYPALVLPRLQTVDVLKGHVRFGRRNAGSRALVAVQNSLSIALMIGATLMIQQLNYVREKDLGYRKEQVVVVPVSDDYSDLYKIEVSRSHRVISATVSDRAFTTGSATLGPVETIDGERFGVRVIRIDPDFLKTMDIQLVAGRDIRFYSRS